MGINLTALKRRFLGDDEHSEERDDMRLGLHCLKQETRLQHLGIPGFIPRELPRQLTVDHWPRHRPWA